MQWHSAEAVKTGGAEVLWWSDHTFLFDQSETFSVDFRSGVVDLNTLDVIEMSMSNNPRQVTWLDSQLDGGSPTVSVLPDGLLIQLRSDATSVWRSLAYELKGPGSRGIILGLRLPRPISSGAKLDIQVLSNEPTEDSFIEINVWLAWHHETIPVQHRLSYQIVSNLSEPVFETVSEAEVVIRIPYDPSGNYTLDLLEAGSRLRYGDDNTISRISVGVAARGGASVEALFQDLALRSIHPEPLHQLEVIKAFAQRYERAMNLHEYVGVEFGGSLSPHLNAFVPDGIQSEDLLAVPSEVEVADWIERVHDRGGVVSFNHPFGTRSGDIKGQSERELALSEVAAELVSNRVLGADILEVGYLDRGGLTLQEHLRLWDILTANGIFIVGTGVSDSHGGFWKRLPNPIVSWVYSDSDSAHDLVAGLKAGRVFFGNPFRWDGTFAVGVGERLMGDRAPVQETPLPLRIDLNPWPGDFEVRLVQGLIEPSQTVHYLHQGTPVTRNRTIAIDVSRPSFVRLEVYEHPWLGKRRPVLFSNPVVFLESLESPP